MASVKFNIGKDLKVRDASGTLVTPQDNQWIDVGNTTDVEIKLEYSKYCTLSDCEFTITDGLTNDQWDAVFREYIMTYRDDNGCEVTKSFKACGMDYTRPIDNVSSSWPIWMRSNYGSPVHGYNAFNADSFFCSSGTCQGINNGFAESSFTEFYVSDDGENWTQTTRENCWCKITYIEGNHYAGTGATDITGGTDNCCGLMRYETDTQEISLYMPNRKGGVYYGADPYITADSGATRYCKMVLNLGVNTIASVDAYSSLVGVLNDPEEAVKSAIDSVDLTGGTFVGHDSNNNTITGPLVRFMSPVEIYLYQNASGYQYTYTVYSDVEGAQIEFSAKSGSQSAHTYATVTNGVATFTTTTEYPEVYAYATKEGVRFSNNPVMVQYDVPEYINDVSPKNTFTIKSNVEDASVTWKNNGTVVSIGQIYNGKSQLYSSLNDNLEVYISKSGYTFDNSGSGICAVNGSITINGAYVEPCSATVYTVGELACSGSTQASRIAAYSLNGTCDTSSANVLHKSGANFLNGISLNNGYIYANYNAASAYRQGTYTLSGNGFSADFTVVQNKCVEPCGGSLSITVNNLASTGSTNQVIGTYTVTGDCSTLPSITYVSGTNFVTVVASNGNIVATYSENNTGDRTATYRFEIGGFSSNFTLTQPKKEVPCVITTNAGTYALSSTGGTDEVIGTYSTQGDCVATRSVPTATVSFKSGSGTDFLSSVSAVGGNITASYGVASAYREGTYILSIATASTEIKVTQSAAACRFTSMTITRPSLDCGGSASQLIGTYSTSGGCGSSLPTVTTQAGSTDYFGVSVSPGVISASYGAAPMQRSATYVISTADESRTFTLTQDECTSSCDSLDIYKPYCDSLDIYVPYSYTVYSDVDAANVVWSDGATGSTTIVNGSATTANTTGTPVRVTLSKSGVVFENSGVGIIQPNGSVRINRYVAPVYSYTVYSNITGASVNWSNGETGVTVGVGSTAYNRITANTNNTLTVLLTKTGVTFENGGTGTCVANGSVTINSGSTGTCNGNISITAATGEYGSDHIPGSGNSSWFIGSWAVTGDCSSQSGITCISGDDFLYNFVFNSGGGIQAAAYANPTTSQRSSTYRATYGTGHSDFQVTQLAGTGSSCTCEDLKLTGNTVDSSAGSKLIGTYSTTCVTGLTVSSSASWLSSLTIGSGTIGATLTQNTGSSRSATITVNGTTVSGTSCQKTFTVTQSGEGGTQGPCGDNRNATSSLGSGSPVSSSVTTTPVKIGTWTKLDANCSTNWEFDSSRSVSGDNFIDTSSIEFRSDKGIYANVNKANTGSSMVNIQIPVKLGSIMTDYFNVWQATGGSASCTCSDLTLTGNTVDSTAGSKLIGTYSTTCVTGLTVSSSAAWISSLTIGSGTIGATLTQNTGSSRSATITVNGTTVSGTSCQKTFTVTQSGATPTPTGCYVNFKYEWGTNLPASGGTRQEIGYLELSGSTDCYNSSAFTCISGDDFLYGWEYNESTKFLRMNVYENPTTSPRTSVYRMTLGNSYDDVTVTQLGRSST